MNEVSLLDDIDTETASAPAPAEELAAERMKLVAERQTLLKSLSHIQSVVERRTTIPVLSNVKLDAREGKVQLTATDMDIAIIETVTATVEREGVLTVPAHTLYDIVRKLPDNASVTLEAKSEEPGKLYITAANSKFTLPYLSAKEFPVMNEEDMSHHFALSASECKALIEKTRFAMSTEETRYYLNGIFFHAAEGKDITTFQAVAIDGHRLARMEVALPEGALQMPGVIVPRKTVTELHKLLDDSTETIQVAVSASKIRFSYGSIILLSKLIDGTFPDYEKLIPANNDKIMEVDRHALMKAADRVSTISADKSSGIKCSIEAGRLTLSATDNSGSATEDLEVSYSATPLSIGFNSRYMLEMLSALEGETVQFVLADNASPAIVRDTTDVGVLYLIMPMKV